MTNAELCILELLLNSIAPNISIGDLIKLQLRMQEINLTTEQYTKEELLEGFDSLCSRVDEYIRSYEDDSTNS